MNNDRTSVKNKKKIWIIGPPGSGKSTLANYYHNQLNIPSYCLDDYFWLPNWNKVELSHFQKEVSKIAKSDCWIIEGQYKFVHDLLGEKADLIVWLDLKLSTVFYRALKRTIKQLISKETLCNGNKQTFKQSLVFLTYVIKIYPIIKKENLELLKKLKQYDVEILRKTS